MDFIELFNQVAHESMLVHSDFKSAKSMDEKIVDIGIDSLDIVLVMMIFCDIYGINPEITDDWYPVTIEDFYDLLSANKTIEPSSIEEAIKAIK